MLNFHKHSFFAQNNV